MAGLHDSGRRIMLDISDCGDMVMIIDDDNQQSIFVKKENIIDLHRALDKLIEKWDIEDKTPEVI
jgi:hypothetical protein